MDRRDNTPWINEGSLRARFRQVGDKLVRETNQPDRDLVMENIVEERKHSPRQNFLGGYKVASIPLVDWERVKLKYPELESKDADLAKKALIRFSNDPDMSEFKFKGA